MKLKAVVGLLLAFQLAAVGGSAQLVPEASKLVVSAEGRVAVAPDMATLSLGVQAEAAEAAVAMREMSARMRDVLDVLDGAGVEPRDIQTSGLSLAPRRTDRRAGDPPARIEAFVASTDVTVRVRDLTRLGALLDAVSQDGANRFSGLRFGLQSPQATRDAAAKAAVAEAFRKAALLADAAGVGLGPVLLIEERGGGGEPRMMRAEMDMSAGSVPVTTGEIDIRASVTITWGLLQ